MNKEDKIKKLEDDLCKYSEEYYEYQSKMRSAAFWWNDAKKELAELKKDEETD